MGRKKKVIESENPVTAEVEVSNANESALNVLNPLIPKRVTKVWDCACDWNRLGYKWKSGLKVFGTDLIYSPDFDFLKMSLIKGFSADDSAIITRPPNSLKVQFYKRCMEHNLPFALLIKGSDEWIDEAVSYGARKVPVNAEYFWICVGF